MTDNVPKVATPETVTRTTPIPSHERRELTIDAKAAAAAGYWLFNEEATALIQSHDRQLRSVLELLEVGEVDDAIALIERVLSPQTDPAQTQIESSP
jgi:hypothetical protein